MAERGSSLPHLFGALHTMGDKELALLVKELEYDIQAGKDIRDELRLETAIGFDGLYGAQHVIPRTLEYFINPPEWDHDDSDSDDDSDCKQYAIK
jgi:hypothetical protein